MKSHHIAPDGFDAFHKQGETSRGGGNEALVCRLHSSESGVRREGPVGQVGGGELSACGGIGEGDSVRTEEGTGSLDSRDDFCPDGQGDKFCAD